MRKLVLLLAASLALTACTAAPEVSSPAEAAPPAETAAIGEAATAFPVGTLQMAIPEVMDTGTASVEITFTGLETEPILKLDYAVGVQTKLCDIDLSRQIPVAIMQHGDTMEYFWDSEGGPHGHPPRRQRRGADHPGKILPQFLRRVRSV